MRGEERQREFLPLTVPVVTREIEVSHILWLLLGGLACLVCWLITPAYEYLTSRWFDGLAAEWIDTMFSDGSLGWPIFLVVSLLVALLFILLGLLVLLARALMLSSLGSFLVSFSARLKALLSGFSEGKLTLDRDGLSLEVGGVGKSMSWQLPICVRRWGVRFEGDRRSKGGYEVWELTQGQVRILLSRTVTLQKLGNLSLPPEEEPASGKDVGLRVPWRHQQVFDAILWMGDVELRNAQGRLWRESA